MDLVMKGNMTTKAISFLLMVCLFSIMSPNKGFADEVDCDSVAGSFQEACQGEASVNGSGEEPGVMEVPEEEQAFQEQNIFFLFLQMFAALAFVLFLIYVVMRFISQRSRSFKSTQALQNLGGVPLGSNRSVQLIKVGDRLFVVGVGESIQLLKEITNEQEKEELLAKQQTIYADSHAPITKAMTWVQDLTKRNRSSAKDEPLQEGQPFKQLLQKQLSDVQSTQERIRKAMREQDKS